MSTPADLPQRRAEDHFGIGYVVERLERAVENLSKKIDAMATKGETGLLFAKMDEKADRDDTDRALEKIDKRLTSIERNQLPPWTIGVAAIAATIILAVVSHFWK